MWARAFDVQQINPDTRANHPHAESPHAIPAAPEHTVTISADNQPPTANKKPPNSGEPIKYGLYTHTPTADSTYDTRLCTAQPWLMCRSVCVCVCVRTTWRVEIDFPSMHSSSGRLLPSHLPRSAVRERKMSSGQQPIGERHRVVKASYSSSRLRIKHDALSKYNQVFVTPVTMGTGVGNNRDTKTGTFS